MTISNLSAREQFVQKTSFGQLAKVINQDHPEFGQVGKIIERFDVGNGVFLYLFIGPYDDCCQVEEKYVTLHLDENDIENYNKHVWVKFKV